MRNTRLNCQVFRGRRTLSELPGSPAQLTETESANKGFIISWPFHRRWYLPLDMMRVSKPLTLSFPLPPLPLISSISMFRLPSHSVLMRTFISTEVCEVQSMRMRRQKPPAELLHYLWPSSSPSIHLPALFSLFRCLPVHLTAGIKKLSLNCCRCPTSAVMPPSSQLPPSCCLSTGPNEPCGGNDSLLYNPSWEYRVTTGGKSVTLMGSR